MAKIIILHFARFIGCMLYNLRMSCLQTRLNPPLYKAGYRPGSDTYCSFPYPPTEYSRF